MKQDRRSLTIAILLGLLIGTGVFTSEFAD